MPPEGKLIMKKGLDYRGWIIISLALLVMQEAATQGIERQHIGLSVTYVSSASAYLSGGRTQGLAVGDTVTIMHGLTENAVGVIMAVSSSSSYASLVVEIHPLTVGDSAFVDKVIVREESVRLVTGSKDATSGVAQKAPGTPSLVSGRFALLYGGAGTVGQPLGFSQPGAVMRLDVVRLFGTGARLSMYGRTYYDLSTGFERYDTGSRLKMRMYELSLSYDIPGMWYGYSVGRIASRQVGGLGVFDGGQLFIRKGRITVGVLAGTQADYATSAVNPELQKYAGFLNVGWGGDILSSSNITVAYGQQLFKGKPDRDFLYLQGSLRFGSNFFLYQSTEVDIHDISEGQRVAKPHLTNTFVTATYAPVSWLTVNAGYDAARIVYLFESMKSISDTLLDRTLKEGYRLSLLFRLPVNLVVTTDGTFRAASGTTGAARTLGASLRAADILGSDLNFGLRYANIRGLYTGGDDVTLDLDRWIAQSLLVSCRFNRYEYKVTGQEERNLSLAAGANVTMRLFRSYYWTLNVDHVWDEARISQRYYCELGIHF
jgi:hypothetical protein